MRSCAFVEVAHNAEKGDQRKAVVFVLVVQLWLPVVASIHGLITRGVLGVSSLFFAHGHVVAGTTDDCVNMATKLSRGEDGIGTLNRERSAMNNEETARAGSNGSSRRERNKCVEEHFEF